MKGSSEIDGVIQNENTKKADKDLAKEFKNTSDGFISAMEKLESEYNGAINQFWQLEGQAINLADNKQAAENERLRQKQQWDRLYKEKSDALESQFDEVSSSADEASNAALGKIDKDELKNQINELEKMTKSSEYRGVKIIIDDIRKRIAATQKMLASGRASHLARGVASAASSGPGMGVIIAIVVVLILVVGLIIFFTIGPGKNMINKENMAHTKVNQAAKEYLIDPLQINLS